MWKRSESEIKVVKRQNDNGKTWNKRNPTITICVGCSCQNSVEQEFVIYVDFNDGYFKLYLHQKLTRLFCHEEKIRVVLKLKWKIQLFYLALNW